MAVQTPRIDTRHARFRLSVRKSAIHRWGVFAEERIPANRKVIEYTGEKISRKESKRRSEKYEITWLFTLNSYWCIDGNVGGSGAELINHSCDPNLRTWISRGEHILFSSVREIAAGEELTIDYHFGKDVERVVCKCGAKNCRGTINLTE